MKEKATFHWSTHSTSVLLWHLQWQSRLASANAPRSPPGWGHHTQYPISLLLVSGKQIMAPQEQSLQGKVLCCIEATGREEQSQRPVLDSVACCLLSWCRVSTLDSSQQDAAKCTRWFHDITPVYTSVNKTGLLPSLFPCYHRCFTVRLPVWMPIQSASGLLRDPDSYASVHPCSQKKMFVHTYF